MHFQPPGAGGGAGVGAETGAETGAEGVLRREATSEKTFLKHVLAKKHQRNTLSAEWCWEGC